MSKPYPFRFYGLAPGDWFEGANIGHAYEVHFASAPKAAAKKQIATAFETALASLPVAADDDRARWLWSGEWATFLVGERGEKARETFAAMAEVFKAIHAVAPLVEVVYHGVRARGRDPWEQWSIEQQAAPGPAPEWPGLDFSNDVFGALQERTSAAAQPDATFEKTRETVRKKLEKAGTKAAARKAIKRGKPALVPVAPPQSPALPGANLFSKDARLEVAGGRTFALDGYHADAVIGWVEGEQATKVKVPWLVTTAFDFDGARVLYCASKIVSEMAVPGATAIDLLDCSRTQSPVGVAYGPDDTILLVTNFTLTLCRREGKTLETVAWVEVPASSVQTYRGGKLAVVLTYKKRVVVYAVTATSLEQLASFKSDAYTSYELDGRIYLANATITTELVNV